MLTLQAKTLLFFTSYCPLLLIVAVRNLEAIESALGPWAAAGAAAIGAAVFALLLAGTQRVFARYEQIRGRRYNLHGKTEKGEMHILLYFITCVIPFVAVNALDAYSIASYGIILAMTAFLYIRSGLVYLNPVLAVLKLNVYRVSMAERNVTVITKRRHAGAARGEIVDMAEGVYYERRG